MEMNAVAVVNHPHPVLPLAGRETRVHAWQAGETLRGLLLRQGLDAQTEIVITLNDRLVPVAEWDVLCPQPSDIINVQAVVSGGGDDDGGSNVIKAVISIVIAVVAWEVGGWAALEWGFAEGTASYLAVQAGVSAAVSMAGNMVVGAVFKPSGRSLSDANGAGADASPTYSLSGGSNSLRPYEPLPVVIGSHRLFPDYGAKPYTEFQGEDQYLYQLFNFGLSSLALSDFRIGETLLTDFADVTQVWSDADGLIPGFPGNVDSIAGATLTRGAAWTTRTTATATQKIAVDLETQAYYHTGKDYLPVDLTLEAEYAPTGTSTWQPFATRTLVSTTTHHWSLHTTYTDDLFNQVNTFIAFGSTVYGDHLEGDSVVISTDFDGLPVLAYWRWTLNTTAIARGWPMPPPIESYSYSNSIVIGHATQKAQRTMLTVDVAAGQYDVRLRLTGAAVPEGEISDGDTRGGWSVNFATLRSYQEDTASYVGQQRMGLVIKASGQLSGVVQQLSCLAEASCRLWDGMQVVWAKTSNPAWWFIDFALGRRNAVGEKVYGCHLDLSAIDTDALIAWAAFCETEGLRCDMILDRRQSAFEVLSIIAKCGLASPTWAAGRLGVVWDARNASPVAAFGMSNIIKGSFSVQYLTENLADEIVVSYVDRDLDWSQQQVRVTVPGVTTPEKTSTAELMGCTTAAQAGKYANYLAAGQYYRRRMVSWETDFEGFVCQRGDVVLLSHDLTQWGYSGRLVTVAGSTVTLDRAVPRTGATETLLLALPDGSLVTYTAMSSAAGDAEMLTLTAPLALQSGYAAVDHRWFWSPLATPGKRVKIVSVRPVSASRIAIVATDEYPEFYAAWDGTWSQVQPDSLLALQPGIVGVDWHERLVPAGSGWQVELSISLQVIGAYDHARAVFRLDGEPLAEVTINGRQFAGMVPDGGVVTAELTPISGLGMQGPAFSAAHTIIGTAALIAMPAPSAIDIDTGTGQFMVTCALPDHRAFSGLLVHLSETAGFTPGAATLAYQGVGNQAIVTKMPDAAPLPNGTPLFLRLAYYSADVDMAPVFADELSFTLTTAGSSKLLTLSTSSQVFKVVAGVATPATITLAAVAAGGLDGVASFSVTAGTATLTGAGNSRTLAFADMSSDVVTIRVEITDGAVFADTVTIAKLQDGSSGVTALLTNESHTLAADAAGTVASFTGAETFIKVFVGATDDTANWTFSAPAVAGVTHALTTTAGANYGKLAVSAMSVDAVAIDITASKSGFPSLTKRFSLAKSKAGADGKGFALIADRQAVTFDGVGNLSPASQQINLKTSGSGVTGAVTWSSSRYTSAGTPFGALTLIGGSGGWDKYFTGADFNTSSTAYATVTATQSLAAGGSVSDTVTFVRLKDGLNAIVGFLTNESHNVPTAADGSGGSYGTAGGAFKLFDGLVDKTGNASATYSVVTSSGVSISIAATGVYTVSGLSADTGTATLRVVYVPVSGSSVTIDKVYSIAKSKAGTNGTNGTNGAPGTAGVRGSMTFYDNTLFSAAWDEAKANAKVLAVTGFSTKVVGDTMVQSYGSTFTVTRYWNATAWVTPGTIIDGNLLVTGSVAATAVGAGLMTGQQIQTAAAGERLTLNSGYAAVMNGYNSSNSLKLSIYATGEIRSFSGNSANGIYGQCTSVSAGNAAVCGDGGSTGSGVRGSHTSGKRGMLGGPNYGFYNAIGEGKHYIPDGAGPFTGFHDALLPKSSVFVPGDIVVDTAVVLKPDINNALSTVALSAVAGQRGVIGVISAVREIDADVALPYALWWEFQPTHWLASINALGEGLINVCGLGGDLLPGDLIEASALPGKGQRSADDVLRGNTVAKCREAVTFDSPDTVVQVACIYLCG